jgi:Ni,Fe-hydrogenase III large subunit
MKYYKWSDRGKGRKIGRLGKYCLYEREVTEETCEIERTKREKTYGSFKFVYGPSAGGLLESIKFDIITDGERILDINATSFKDRVIKIRGLNVNDALLRIERINAPFSASHTLSFLLSVEDALNIDQDYQVQLRRIIQLELERIRNHLFVISRLTEMASLSVPAYELLSLVEELNRIIGNACGHRYFFGVNQINDVKCNFEGIDKRIEKIQKMFETVFEGLIESRIFIDRLQSNGKLKDENSIGPAARASGFPYDARVDSNFLPYKDFNISPVIREEGDAFGRFLVRGYEILESSMLIKDIMNNLRGISSVESPKLRGEGEGLARVESPSGDLAYYVKINDDIIKEILFLYPSSINLDLFLKSVVGTIFTDFPFNWESFGIWISEIGVKLV